MWFSEPQNPISLSHMSTRLQDVDLTSKLKFCDKEQVLSLRTPAIDFYKGLIVGICPVLCPYCGEANVKGRQADCA